MNFLARLIVGGVIAFATIAILETSKRKFEEEEKARRDKNKAEGKKEKAKDNNNSDPANTHEEYLFDFETFSPPGAKRKITKALKEIMAKYKTRKIGRTGDPYGRLGNYGGKYKHLFLLTKSKDLGIIKDLEVAYINKFQKELSNKNPGILGANETADGWYYLYVAVK